MLCVVVVSRLIILIIVSLLFPVSLLQQSTLLWRSLRSPSRSGTVISIMHEWCVRKKSSYTIELNWIDQSIDDGSVEYENPYTNNYFIIKTYYYYLLISDSIDWLMVIDRRIQVLIHIVVSSHQPLINKKTAKLLLAITSWNHSSHNVITDNITI